MTDDRDPHTDHVSVLKRLLKGSVSGGLLVGLRFYFVF